ncbi:unnamed protein product [Adineta steineri]|uniref:Uncharacterized protein n=1 Tax=Adineta steineri TaxID=433720 RepID=A0A819Q910_9BILA|nr:unnamed protein product [Adineta steineri]CAF4026763.1 unnamed protein product [Adineta steineri]
MLLSSNIRLKRILITTWKVDLVMLATCCIAYSFHYYLLSKHFDIPVLVPTVLGTAIAFFIGFNNNQAYDRWWEARRIWGALVNDSRSWTRSALNYISNENNNSDVQQLVYRHIAFVYLLKNNLRSLDDAYFKKFLTDDDVQFISNQTNKSNAVLQLQSLHLKKIYDNKLIDGYQFLQLDSLLVKFTDEMGMSERIKNTVFPTTYSYLTKVFIWLFVIAVQLVTVQSMGVWSILMSWIIGFVFVSTQLNGMSLVNPFEEAPVSIPLNQIARTIEINLLQMTGASEIPEPVKPINNEYVL